MGCAAAQCPITLSVSSKTANNTRFEICPPCIVVAGDVGGKIAEAAGKDKPPIQSAPVSGLCQRGSVNLSRLRRKDGRKKRPSERVGRILGDFGEFAPGNESRRELFAIE